MTRMVQAALNGARWACTADELAAEAIGAVTAGAHVVHVHAYEGGHETLAAEPCAAVVAAIRAACPGVPISLTTSADIVSDPAERLELVAGWAELPELVTVNQGEAGVAELCALLAERGIGIEAGLLALSDAETFARSGFADACVRVLVEPLDEDPAVAVEHAAAMEAVLEAAGIELPQVHHGEGIASWTVNERAVRRGHGIRTGIEDCPVLPDGTPARDNAELVRAAVALG
ncbi:MAG TPA: 3-keto-5-aminohexanoate cleavage protein [Gaiellaceae bacterium]|nr:3-keto-5-aminohexanoate cleavage protein [Gaiellaceae bacterium]